jgi:hypothetical protein
MTNQPVLIWGWLFRFPSEEEQMSENFQSGDKVVFEDAYTGEVKYGLITNMNGSDPIIRMITQEEAGPNPKPLPRPRIACSIQVSDDGTRVCGYHRKPLSQLAVHGDPNPPGLGHLSAWVCPESNKPLYETEGM